MSNIRCAVSVYIAGFELINGLLQGPFMNGIRYNADNVRSLKPFTHEPDQISKTRR